MTAIANMLMSQAPTLRSLVMDHTILPPRHMGNVASLQTLTSLTVRALAAQSEL